MTSDARKRARLFWRRGEPMVWAAGGSVTLVLLFTVLLIGVVMVNGLSYFWPHPLAEVKLADGSTLIGRQLERDPLPTTHEAFRRQFKIGNRDLNPLDFRWVNESEIRETHFPADLITLERLENGNFYGRIQSLTLPMLDTPAVPAGGDLWQAFQQAHDQLLARRAKVMRIEDRMATLARQKQGEQRAIARLRYKGAAADDPRIREAEQRIAALDKDFYSLNDQMSSELGALRANTVTMVDGRGRTKAIPLIGIVRAYRPNAMNLAQQIGFYLVKVHELLFDEPREANTEGGLFPAIFGTVLMVMLMSVFCIPMGVIAAIYLREYAREGVMVRLVRIAVNNLAGVPSIVYGVFGLGFFVYGLGGSIDRLFFPEVLPTPTFGTGGILWASLTLALLTVPVVIVATEESLAAVPRGIREGSLALGATKFQTLVRILLPMATPGILTGLILAMARAAGEVAPLMIVGVVKLAPTLPLDGSFPYTHLERKFMHLAFAIFDSGFQSPNVEAARPMVFVTTLLLLLIVLLMCASAIYLRNMMRKRYTTGAF